MPPDRLTHNRNPKPYKINCLDKFTYWKIYSKLSYQISQWLVSDEYNVYFTLKANFVLSILL